ncbi:hypothetical protein D3C85_1457960 [compost metagenome]
MGILLVAMKLILLFRRPIFLQLLFPEPELVISLHCTLISVKILFFNPICGDLKISNGAWENRCMMTKKDTCVILPSCMPKT